MESAPDISKALSIDQQRKLWTVLKAPNGITYYMNTQTKKSQWEKPDCFKSADERQLMSETEWQEYTSGDGRPFYVSKKTNQSTWQMPDELKAIKQRLAEQRKQRIQNGLPAEEDELIQPVDSLIKPKKVQKTQEELKDQQYRAFNDLMKEQDITSGMKFDAGQKLLQNDPRWQAIPQISEKRRLFNEYCSYLKKKERQQARSKNEKARDDFFRMLEEANLKSEAKFYRQFPRFTSDPRWRAIDERQRESMFQDYLDEMYEREQQDMKRRKQQNWEILREQLQKHPSFSSNYYWQNFCQDFKSEKSFTELFEIDRINIFEDAMTEQERSQNQNNRYHRRLTQRKNRQQMRDLLRELVSKGEINHQTQWKQVFPLIQYDNRLHQMLGQQGSAPHELFEDQRDDLSQHLQTHKQEFQDYFKNQHQYQQDNYNSENNINNNNNNNNNKKNQNNFDDQNYNNNSSNNTNDNFQGNNGSENSNKDNNGTPKEGVPAIIHEEQDEAQPNAPVEQIRILPETTRSEFDELLSGFHIYSKLDETKKSFYFFYFKNQAQSKEKGAAQQKKKLMKKFHQLLKQIPDIKLNSEYNDYDKEIMQMITQSARALVVLTNDEQQLFFESFLQKQREKEEKDSDSDEHHPARHQIQRTGDNGSGAGSSDDSEDYSQQKRQQNKHSSNSAQRSKSQSKSEKQDAKKLPYKESKFSKPVSIPFQTNTDSAKQPNIKEGGQNKFSDVPITINIINDIKTSTNPPKSTNTIPSASSNDSDEVKKKILQLEMEKMYRDLEKTQLAINIQQDVKKNEQEKDVKKSNFSQPSDDHGESNLKKHKTQPPAGDQYQTKQKHHQEIEDGEVDHQSKQVGDSSSIAPFSSAVATPNNNQNNQNNTQDNDQPILVEENQEQGEIDQEEEGQVNSEGGNDKKQKKSGENEEGQDEGDDDDDDEDEQEDDDGSDDSQDSKEQKQQKQTKHSKKGEQSRDGKKSQKSQQIKKQKHKSEQKKHQQKDRKKDSSSDD